MDSASALPLGPCATFVAICVDESEIVILNTPLNQKSLINY
ncbi:hypothetical protein SynMVIR181_01638 [Synechococcus sp. MVIR-18-1]|nr:hypothetical protein SynMVIR181_01638 [Synechococcus sp. MVIR-18-1]